ncbi:glyoxalase/bleomycin resistance protein/dioxygenase [Zopfia rhizophila CBS 207.26]|uniref:Glyoxalase/bleomycin resistance protein/dioxygenase n=1 Tax=Zopfia rhizophila CBS 207.26 TaxID=1314779 RepID=A0A6A6ERQ5_9PEZI|nr:glyoxalase/bleomycin resistance protein/dioxygenase [Zopfia rhizophila CBS 207.26]
MTVDHFGFAVPPSQFEEIINWYLAALAPIGYAKQMEFPGQAVGLGPSKYEPHFWIAAKEDATSGSGFHLAFKAKDHAAVDKFYEEAIKAGGKDNGKPGLRADYHPKYYGAFVLDPVGLVLNAPVIGSKRC